MRWEVDWEAARAKLLQGLAREIKDKRVLEVIGRMPRERFVPPEGRGLAYEDMPLSIGSGQTISQPFIVALMTQALELKGDERVLELGTGSGYQTAILAELARHVVSVERLVPLAEAAWQILAELGYTNVDVHFGLRTLGWKAGAPYDAIMVTAGAPRIPQELLDQLVEGGRIVIPVGSRSEQELLKVVKGGLRAETQKLGPCRFVPLVGEGAWAEEGGFSWGLVPT